jgi:hypothetical protein
MFLNSHCLALTERLIMQFENVKSMKDIRNSKTSRWRVKCQTMEAVLPCILQSWLLPSLNFTYASECDGLPSIINDALQRGGRADRSDGSQSGPRAYDTRVLPIFPIFDLKNAMTNDRHRRPSVSRPEKTVTLVF